MRSFQINSWWNLQIANKLISKTTIIDRFADRQKEINSLYDLNYNKQNLASNIKTSLAEIKVRWENYKDVFIIGEANLTYSNLIALNPSNLIKLDNQQIQEIKLLPNSTSAINAINEANENLHKILENIDRLNEEKENQWNRFDNIYNSDATNNFIAKLNEYFKNDALPLTNAEFKAWHAQESWDFTNKTIKGISDKSKGITTNIENPFNNPKNKKFKALDYIVGVAQLQKSTTEDAIKWADDEKTINQKFENDREGIQSNIFISGSYLGYLMENKDYGGLRKQSTNNGVLFLPKGKDLKRILLAGFNGGPEKINDIFRLVQKRFATPSIPKNKIYDWEAIKVVLPDETKGYIPSIESRLKLK